MRKQWRLWVAVAISVVALILALLRIDLHLALQTLARANYLYLIPATVGLLVYLIARAVRWRLLLGPEVSLARCFWVVNIGYLVSNVLPFRLGDPARAVAIGRSGPVSVAAALSTVVVERVLDMLMVVLILAGVAPFISGAGDALQAGLLAGVLALAVLAVLFVLAFRPDWGRRAVRWGLARFPRVDVERWARPLDGLFDGLAPLRSGRRGLALLGWSIVVWGCVVFYYWALLRAFIPSLSALAAPFLVCVVGLGMSIPSSPGAVGVFHAIARYALTGPFGVPPEQAVAAAFAAHAFQYLPVCVLGVVGLARESLSLRWLQEQAHLSQDAPEVSEEGE